MEGEIYYTVVLDVESLRTTRQAFWATAHRLGPMHHAISFQNLFLKALLYRSFTLQAKVLELSSVRCSLYVNTFKPLTMTVSSADNTLGLPNLINFSSANFCSRKAMGHPRHLV